MIRRGAKGVEEHVRNGDKNDRSYHNRYADEEGVHLSSSIAHKGRGEAQCGCCVVSMPEPYRTY